MNQSSEIEVAFNQLSGRQEALFRAFGLLVRQLHISGVTDARNLADVCENHADRLSSEHPVLRFSGPALAEISESLQTAIGRWDEDRETVGRILACQLRSRNGHALA